MTAGLALLSLGAASVTPVGGPTATTPVASESSGESYRLAAASHGLTAGAAVGHEPSLANVPANLLTLMLSIPAWHIQAMDRFAEAMIATGSWQVWGPTNVVGFDEQDPPKLKAVMDMMLPILPLSSVLGDQFSWWAKANLPMNSGCAARPGACPDLKALLDNTFKVRTSQLNEGYQFPAVTNPFTGEPTTWSGQYVKLDPRAPVTALLAYLTGPRQAAASVSIAEASAVIGKTLKSVADAYNPFVPNSEWFNPEQTGLAPVFRAAAPTFCRSCDPENPYANPWLYENYQPDRNAAPSAAVPPAVSAGGDVAPGPVDLVDPGPAGQAAGNGIEFAGNADAASLDDAGPARPRTVAAQSEGAAGTPDRTPRPAGTRASARSAR